MHPVAIGKATSPDLSRDLQARLPAFSAPACTRVPTAARRLPVHCQATPVAPAPTPKGVSLCQPKDLLNRTYYPTSADSANVKKKWYIINAEGKTLGRLASLAAYYIRGKHMPTYTPSMDMGGYVIVINADKVTVTGKKFTDKTYFRHTNGRPGSYRIEHFNELQKRLPERIIELAVKGMLPKGRLGKHIRLHLKAFKGPTHPHQAQQPTDITAQINIKPKKSPGAVLLASLRAAKEAQPAA
ncbi:hypothetical protein QJQ45_019780 [Haematococcus lacustris]|nr:hypothetical protein QJQ45_023770 [Haematococcus lacustris]KAJ9522794.1 hypothetical protein QJQ45_019780 [Haematococcus lacustris]